MLAKMALQTGVGIARTSISAAAWGMRWASRVIASVLASPRRSAEPWQDERVAQSPDADERAPARYTEPHHELNTPVGEPDPTEWPDPYDQRPDPRDPVSDPTVVGEEVPHTSTGATSTSAPHPSQDPQAYPDRAGKRLDPKR